MRIAVARVVRIPHSTSLKRSPTTPVHNLACQIFVARFYPTRRRHRVRPPQAKIRYFTFAIFTILPFACESFGSFTTVTYNAFSPSPNATFVVPSPAAISNTCRSLCSGDIFKILPLSCHQPVALNIYSAPGLILNAPIGFASGCGSLFMRSVSM